MEDRAAAFLRRLLDAPGPSGYESAPLGYGAKKPRPSRMK